MRAFLSACLSLAVLSVPASAQDRIPSHCIALADAAPGIEYVHRASFGQPLPENRVRISYLHHATFLLETAGGLSVATDYTGLLGSVDHVPTVVTMNNAHSTHWTASPDPRIPHVLKGWAEGGQAARHNLDLGEMLVRNVPTDVRSGWDDTVARVDGNSIFVFEVAGLCVGHLGHLHHEPTEEQYATLGRLDVVMAPVDGGYTLDLPGMMRVIGRLRSSVVLPMHWFSGRSLEVFLAGMEDRFDVVRLDQNHIELSLGDLPGRPTIIVLEPRLLR
jgi:L-ascorbate metabolism protein UlaG (beta-lactamase superfamily)